MKWTSIVVAGILALGLVQAAQSAYILGDVGQRRLTVIGKQVVLGYGSTVWHGERGGRLFAFLDGKRMYLAASTNGEVLLKENAAEALKWDFSETKAGKQNSEYYVPRVSSSVSTLGLGPVRRNLMIASQDDVKDAQGKLLSNVRSIRLALTLDSKTNTDQATGSMFVIRGTDSKFIRNDEDGKRDRR